MFIAQEVLKPVVDIKTAISKRILLDSWFEFLTRQAKGKTLKNSVVSEVIETLNRNGLRDGK